MVYSILWAVVWAKIELYNLDSNFVNFCLWINKRTNLLLRQASSARYSCTQQGQLEPLILPVWGHQLHHFCGKVRPLKARPRSSHLRQTQLTPQIPIAWVLTFSQTIFIWRTAKTNGSIALPLFTLGQPFNKCVQTSQCVFDPRTFSAVLLQPCPG